ncbi:hypothetical protein NL676_008082 [Syzygium grande]|nr:hypothetical protein NL676_008082 [Syzygium grande]
MNWEKMNLATAFFVLVLVFMANWSADAVEPPSRSLAWPGCPDTCGKLTNIPYPFGIGPGCFLDPQYEIDCQQTSGIFIPVLKNLSVVVLDIRLPKSSHSPGLIRVSQPISYSHLNCTTNQQNNTPVDLTRSSRSSFSYSERENVFVAGGCDTRALMSIYHTEGVVLECKSSCGGNWTLGFDHCRTGKGCCTILINNDIGKYSVKFRTLKDKAIAPRDAECRYAFLVETKWWYKAKLNSLPPDVPVMLKWAIGSDEEYLLSKQSNRSGNDNSGSCRRHSMQKLHLLVCSCNQGYRGNYFLPHGCQGELRMFAFALYLSLILYPKPSRTICNAQNL